ncbi:MAG: hypothetical protein DRI81_07250 [Chloroflexi bacterium]|nr:MAG: hypothetical protein DRI81_07250 [Chloroflexota bacterium]
MKTRPFTVSAFFAITILLTLLAPLSAPTPAAQAQGAFSCSVVTEIPQTECEALVSLYDSTDGDNWTDNSGWLETNTPCSWHGVGCSEGHVRYLDLSENRLSGNIPPELSDLTNLYSLHLYANALNGSIPPGLSNLVNLRDLGLVGNMISGTIPPELGNLSNLEYLGLARNDLTGNIPPELGNLSNLEYLGLADNCLGGNIPSELGNLTQLRYLRLEGDGWMGTNWFSGSIPPELGNLIYLEELDLGGNGLSGNIPTTLGSLTNLRHLDLSGSWGGNTLSGNIPTALGSLTNLYHLDLSYSQLDGNIPPELGNLTNLRYLYLSDNQLTGNIPSELGNLVSLWYLRLSRNQLSGNIPSELGNLGTLYHLGLSGNQLSGNVPSELGNLTNLESLYLSDNSLSGWLPTSLTNLTSLSAFWFDNTYLCEPLDTAFQNWLSGISNLGRTGICTILTDPDAVPADGYSTINLTLDQHLPGRPVRFISSRGGVDQFSSPSGTTDANGQFATSVSSYAPGNTQITVQDEASGQVLPLSTWIAFNPVPPPAPPLPPSQPLPPHAPMPPWEQLRLIAPMGVSAGEGFRLEAKVQNTTTEEQTYNVEISLWRNDSLVVAEDVEVTLGSGETAKVESWFSGVARGTYEVKGRLYRGFSTYSRTSTSLAVYGGGDERQAFEAGEMLTHASQRELDFAQGLVVNAYVDSVPNLGKFIFGQLKDRVMDLAFGDSNPFQSQPGKEKIAGKTLDKLNDWYTEFTHLGELGQLFPSEVERSAEGMVDNYLYGDRNAINQNLTDYQAYIANNGAVWSQESENIYRAGLALIRTGVWLDGFESPFTFFGTTTLWEESLAYDSYAAFGEFMGLTAKAVGWLALALLLASTFITGGVSAPLLAAVPKVKPVLKGVQGGMAVALLLMSMTMDSQLENVVAPEIVERHQDTLLSLQSQLVAGSQDASNWQVQTAVQPGWESMALETTIRPQLAGLPATALAQTYIYSLDGRLIDIQSDVLQVSDSTPRRLAATLSVPPGRYQVVSALNGDTRTATTSGPVQAQGAEATLTIELASTRIDLGNTIDAVVTVINNDSIAGTGEIGVLLSSSDGEHGEGWTLTLGPSEVRQLETSFSPEAEGAFYLAATAIDNDGVPLDQEYAAYVVGQGASLAFNTTIAEVFGPGEAIVATITAHNAGTVAGSAAVTLRLEDYEDGALVGTVQDINFNLAAGQVVPETRTMWGSATAGRYRLVLLVDGDIYAVRNVTVSANNTLYVSAGSDQFRYSLGNTVTATVEVVDRTFALTDADVTLQVVTPLNQTESLTLQPVGTGQYAASYTPAMSGTYQLRPTAQSDDQYIYLFDSVFAVEQESHLEVTVDGRPMTGQIVPVTVTVKSDQDVAIPDAQISLTSGAERLQGVTNEAGQVVFVTAPQFASPYELKAQKTGYTQLVTWLTVAYLDDGVNMTTSEAIIASPGETVVYTQTLVNTSNTTDTFTINSNISEDWWFDISPAGDVQLPPGSATRLEVTINVPPDAGNMTMCDTVITATSQTTSSYNAVTLHSIVVRAEQSKIYLPVVLRN